ncbi:glycosyltransferase [Inhella gelatinilytica]|uniref:glycosyltransferase n=1 Tax=Inhella gelatinilytica TaxID=2795030 RepID=UPI001FEC986A|nr:glycosyltransferase [Inhella gelatinilytica]
MKHLCLLGDANHVHLRRWAAEMVARGWRVSVVTARPESQAGVTQCVLQPVFKPWDWLFRVKDARRAVEMLKPDLIHAHYVTSYGYLGARVADRRPLLITAWGSDLLVTPRESWLKRWLTAWSLRRARAVTGDSADLVAVARELAPQVPAHEVHWGVDLSRFAPVSWGQKPGFEAVSLRSWAPNYRIDLILRALARVRQQHPGAHLHLLGGGPDEAALRALAQELGVESAATFHGRLDDAGMAAVMARCKLSISVPRSDATSVSLLEGMACGLAVLASDLPANRQWLPPECCVPVDDEALLAQRWSAWAAEEAPAAAQGQANAERMVREGARSVQMDRVDALYRAVLNQA